MRIYLLILVCMIIIVATHISITAEETYSYNTDIKSITEGICKECHSFASSYVTVMAKDGFVVPGNPDASEFVWRLEGINASGGTITRMPNGGPYLSDATIQIVRAWIAQGAIEEISTGIAEQVRWIDIKKHFAQ